MPKHREQPGVTVKRAKDFTSSGNYDVTVDGKLYEYPIYRDTENGWWYESGPKHFTFHFMGFNRDEAVEKIVRKMRG